MSDRVRCLGLLVVCFCAAGCDVLLTDPAPPPSTVEVSLQLVAAPLGGPATAFAKVRRARVTFARPDSTTRDTVFSVFPVDGRIRVPVALEVGERVEALGIAASLGVATTSLFQGATIVRIEPGQPTSAVIDVQPVPATVMAEAPLALIPNVGESVRLSSAVLFASLDTITGLAGTWLSEDPSIVTVTPDGTATALQLGQTRLEVRYDTFADTVVVATSPVDSLELFPSDTTLAVGETAQLTAVALDALGNALSGRQVTWTSLNPAIAVVSAAGRVTAVAPGTATVVAASGNALTSASITVTGSATVQWLAAASGSWSDPANWSGNVVPGPGDTVEIVADGTYTVTVDVDPTVGTITFGGSSGTQTLIADGRTVTTSGTFDVVGTGEVGLTSSTVSGAGLTVGPGTTLQLNQTTVASPLTNQGTVEVIDPASVTGALTTSAGSVLRIVGQNVTALTIANGFTNNGLIELSSGIGNASALTVTTGTLTNAAGGTISVIPGPGGPRAINAAIDNQGSFRTTVAMSIDAGGGVITNAGTWAPGAAVTVTNADAFTNTGTLDLSGGDVDMVFTGTGGGFSTAGTLTLGTGRLLRLENGPFASTTVAGAGTLRLVSTTASGAGLTVGPGTTLQLNQTTVASPLTNQGTVEVIDPASVTGALTTSAGSVLRIVGQNVTALTIANGFTNNGLIELSSGIGNASALTVTTGTLTNAAGGTISVIPGPGGPRAINANLSNVGGVLDLQTNLVLAGQLVDPAGVTSTYKGDGVATLTVRGVAIDGALFDGMPLVIDQGPLTQFDNVTFDQMDPASTQLTVRHPGAVTAFQFINLTFLTDAVQGGFYILAEDVDGGAPFLVLDLEGSAALNGALFTDLLGGAVVNWL